MFLGITKNMTALPAVRTTPNFPTFPSSVELTCFPLFFQTAQVANQQGVYLGKKLTKIANNAQGPAVVAQFYDDPDDQVYKPFKYHHSASLFFRSSSSSLVC